MPKSKGVATGGLICLLALAAAAQENQGASPTQTAPAQQATPSAPAAKPEKAVEAKKSKLWGTIQSVDAQGKKVSIKTKKGTVREITMGDASKLTKGGNNKEIGLADLKEGASVTVTLEGDSVHTLHVNVVSK